MKVQRKANIEARFWNYVRVIEECGDECWEWMAYCNSKGYGKFKGDESGYAHRFAWKLANGPIPDGYDVHHTCLNKGCQNAKHMELKTRKEHQALENPLVMAKIAQTHCIHGHVFDEANIYWWRGCRHCKECGKIRMRAFYDRRKMAQQ